MIMMMIMMMIEPEECLGSASSWWEASQGWPSMTRNVIMMTMVMVMVMVKMMICDVGDNDNATDDVTFK